MDDLQSHIEKYLKGELTPSQRHELEMKALNDPFLADALEGAESIASNTFVEDVETINKKILVDKKVNYIWPLRIAASIVFVASVTFLIVKISSKTSTEQLALKKDEIAGESPAVIISDSLEKEESLISNLEKEEKITPKPNSLKKSEISQPREVEKQVIEAPKTEVAEKESSFRTQLEVAEEESKDLPLIKPQESVSAENLKKQNTDVAKARSQELKASPSPSALSGAGATRKKTAKQDMAAEEDLESVSSYQQYLKSNVVYPKAALDSKVDGEVTVSFLVNPDGTLSEFVIEKGIGSGCDEELIRLIKAGPPWQPSSARQSVTFDFVLPNK